MESELYALIHWEDGIRFIVSCDRIVQPRKDPWLYEEGEYITAKYYGTPYRAVISHISTDKQILTEKKKSKYNLQHSYDATKDPKKSADSAVSLPGLEPVTNLQEDMPQITKSSRKKAVAKSSSKAQTTKAPSQAQSKKRAYIEMGCQSSDSDDDNDSLSTPSISEVNSKGHAAIAQKQPRRTGLLLPPPQLSDFISDQVPVLTALACAPVPTPPEPEETIQCLSCSLMAARIKYLEQQLEKQSEEHSSNVPAKAITILKPGVHSEDVAMENKMERLINGHPVFLYLHQKEGAIRKGQGEKKDGRKISRYLVPIFFTKAQRLDGTIAKSGSGQLQKLDTRIVEAILDFSTANSSTTKGNCRDAIANQLSSMRANHGKKQKVKV